jgi:MFS family permease
MLSSFSRLLVVYVLWLASWMLAATLFEVYFFGLGMSPQEIYLANAFWFVASLIVMPFIRGFSSRTFILAGIFVAASCTSILYFFPEPASAYIFRFIIGLTHILFWTPFNVLFYEYHKENNAQLGAIYYSLGPILSLALPTLAGLIAGTSGLGYPVLYLLSLGLYAIAFIAGWFLIEDRKYAYNVLSSLRSISGMKSIIFLEGFAAMVIVSVTLEVMLLSFIDTPFEFGGFLSLVTVFSVIATAVTAKLSDKAQERRKFLLPSAAAFAICAIIASQAPDLLTFFLAFGLISFFSRIFFPLPFALLVDNSKSLVDVMVGRELVLNIGRLAGTLAGYAVFVMFDIRAALLFQGLILLLYIPVFENRKRKLLRH